MVCRALMLNKMFDVSKVFYFICPVIVMECWMVCRALMLNKMFEVSKVSTSFFH